MRMSLSSFFVVLAFVATVLALVSWFQFGHDGSGSDNPIDGRWPDLLTAAAGSMVLAGFLFLIERAKAASDKAARKICRRCKQRPPKPGYQVCVECLKKSGGVG
jgi:hypothetical protein